MKRILLFCLIITFALSFTACSRDGDDGLAGYRVVSDIRLTSSEGGVSVYTVYYLDGTTSTFEVENATSGDGEDVGVTISALYEQYKKIYGDIEYKEFLSLYLGSTVGEGAILNEMLLSTASVYTEFVPRSAIATKNTLNSGGAVIYSVGEEYTYLITNFHVVYSKADSKAAEKIHIYLYGSESSPELDEASELYKKPYLYDSYAIECGLVGYSAEHDIAVIYAKTEDILAKNPAVKAAHFADSYAVGETAVTVGNPRSSGLSVTRGIVSVKSEYIELNLDGKSRSYRTMRIDTPLYNGNSGGAVFNEEGLVIGIANAGAGTDQNINYAIPTELARAVADSIIYYYEDGDDATFGVYKIQVGVRLAPENTHYVYDSVTGRGDIVEDVVITEVLADSSASGLGLLPGDKLVSVTLGDKTYGIERYYNLRDVLLSARVGSVYSLTILRGEKEIVTANVVVTANDLVKVD